MKSPYPVVLGLLFGLAATLSGAAAKPTVALIVQNLPQKNWWWHGGAEALHDVFVTELARSGKGLKPIDVAALVREKGAAQFSLSGELNKPAAVRVGKLLGVNYLMAVVVMAFDGSGESARGTVVVRLIDTSTGEIVWADEFHGGPGREGRPKAFTGSDEELGALIAWVRAHFPTMLQKLASTKLP